LAANTARASGVTWRRDQHLDELLVARRSARRGFVERAVEGQDAAEGRGRVGLPGLAVGLDQAGADATPQGLACLTMTQAGASKVFTHSQAASASAMLL
jgi:hypothetical protein